MFALDIMTEDKTVYNNNVKIIKIENNVPSRKGKSNWKKITKLFHGNKDVNSHLSNKAEELHNNSSLQHSKAENKIENKAVNEINVDSTPQISNIGQEKLQNQEPKDRFIKGNEKLQIRAVSSDDITESIERNSKSESQMQRKNVSSNLNNKTDNKKVESTVESIGFDVGNHSLRSNYTDRVEENNSVENTLKSVSDKLHTLKLESVDNRFKTGIGKVQMKDRSRNITKDEDRIKIEKRLKSTEGNSLQMRQLEGIVDRSGGGVEDSKVKNKKLKREKKLLIQSNKQEIDKSSIEKEDSDKVQNSMLLEQEITINGRNLEDKRERAAVVNRIVSERINAGTTALINKGIEQSNISSEKKSDQSSRPIDSHKILEQSTRSSVGNTKLGGTKVQKTIYGKNLHAREDIAGNFMRVNSPLDKKIENNTTQGREGIKDMTVDNSKGENKANRDNEKLKTGPHREGVCSRSANNSSDSNHVQRKSTEERTKKDRRKTRKKRNRSKSRDVSVKVDDDDDEIPNFGAERPKDFLFESALSCLFCFCPTGTFAICLSLASKRAADQNNFMKAKLYAGHARSFALMSCLVGILALIGFVLYCVLTFVVLVSDTPGS